MSTPGQPEQIYVDLGARIAALRKQMGLTQEALAEAVERDASYVARIETGNRRATISTLQRITEALGVELRDLFPGRVRSNPGSAALEPVLAKLSEEDLALVAGLARRLAGR